MAALTPPTIVAATGRRLADFAAGLNVALAPLAQSVGIASASRPSCACCT